MIFDLAIIGGGPVGSTLALALRHAGLRIAILEARPCLPSQDPRALALSYGSRLLLDKLGIWSRLPQVSGIQTIHISQRRAFGRARLSANQLAVPELGYVLPYADLQNALHQSLGSSAVDYLDAATVTDLQAGADGVRLSYRRQDGEHSLVAKLAVVADGGKLLERSHPPEVHDYGQSAVIAHVSCARPQSGTAFERFTEQGPVALLPYRDGYELVWTAVDAEAQAMLNWDDATFLHRLHQHFGDRVGAFTAVGSRSCFPLRLKRAPEITLPRTVLLGNAAQTLHPVAGQGFNMGIRDAWELAQIIQSCPVAELGGGAMLARYAAARRLDRAGGIQFTDSLVQLFSNDWPLLRGGRALALTALDCLPPLKSFVARRMMFGANG